MRQIEIDLDVFSAIWSKRRPGESNENEVLRRLLLTSDSEVIGNSSMAQRIEHADEKEVKSSRFEGFEGKEEMNMGKIRWVDDIQAVLRELGGRASLQRIYREVSSRRSSAGRSVPRTIEAVIRRTLEDHSSDSANFRGKDIFALVGRGEWALR